MTHKRPRRFTDSQCVQIFFTDDFTFMKLLQSSGYSSAPTVWIESHFHFVADKYFNSMQSHLAG